MKSTRRIASDARYMIASIALVTSMAVFASLGSVRRHDYEAREWTSTPASLSADVVATPTVSDDCTCGTTSAVQIYDSSSASSGPTNITISTTSDDCTCEESSTTATQLSGQTPAIAPDADTPNVQILKGFRIETNGGDSYSDVTITTNGADVQTGTAAPK